MEGIGEERGERGVRVWGRERGGDWVGEGREEGIR